MPPLALCQSEHQLLWVRVADKVLDELPEEFACRKKACSRLWAPWVLHTENSALIRKMGLQVEKLAVLASRYYTWGLAQSLSGQSAPQCSRMSQCAWFGLSTLSQFLTSFSGKDWAQVDNHRLWELGSHRLSLGLSRAVLHGAFDSGDVCRPCL